MCVCVCLICLHRRNHLTATSRRVKFTSIITYEQGIMTIKIKYYYSRQFWRFILNIICVLEASFCAI